jgi:hypothetical protein
LNSGPSGLNRAQAQKFTAKPIVAKPSMSVRRPVVGGGLSFDTVDCFDARGPIVDSFACGLVGHPGSSHFGSPGK